MQRQYCYSTLLSLCQVLRWECKCVALPHSESRHKAVMLAGRYHPAVRSGEGLGVMSSGESPAGLRLDTP